MGTYFTPAYSSNFIKRRWRVNWAYWVYFLSDSLWFQQKTVVACTTGSRITELENFNNTTAYGAPCGCKWNPYGSVVWSPGTTCIACFPYKFFRFFFFYNVSSYSNSRFGWLWFFILWTIYLPYVLSVPACNYYEYCT